MQLYKYIELHLDDAALYIYIELHLGPAAYVLDPPPSRGRDLELEGGVNVCTSSTFTSPETSTCEVPSNGVVEISLLPVCTGETSI